MAPVIPVLPMAVQQRLQMELRSGESLLWADQPVRGTFQGQAIMLCLIGIPFTLFALFWIFVTGLGMDRIFGPFSLCGFLGLPIGLIGVALLTSPFWTRGNIARTVYAITNERAIVIQGRLFGGVFVQSFLPERLTAMTRTERANGSGNLIFDQFVQRAGTGVTTVRRGFFGVRNVREVESLIEATLLAGRVRNM